MKKNHPQILVLGATGMLGRTVYKYLLKLYGKNIAGTSREKNNNAFKYFNFKTSSDLASILRDQKFNFVINCIGALRGESTKNLRLLNHALPKKLEEESRKNNFVIIHISTDAVFPTNAGAVYEDSKPNPSDYYGKTKLAGEITTGINIRSSILGFDPVENKGLLEYVLKSMNKEIIGFTNQMWSGSTTLQLAQFIEWLISANNFKDLLEKTNIIHFVPLGPTTKYEILKTFSKLIFKDKIIKGEGLKQTRILKTRYIEDLGVKRYTESPEKAFNDLINFEQSYVKIYKKN